MAGTAVIKTKTEDFSRFRVVSGLSLRKMSERTGLSVSAISKIERGMIQAVRPNTAKKICTALDKPFDELFTIETLEKEA